MGNTATTASKAIPTKLHYAETLPLRRGLLPRSTQINGRYIIDPLLFPDWTDYITSGGSFVKWRWNHTDAATVPSTEVLERDLPVHTPSKAQLSMLPPSDQTQVTWLGHACCLVQWEGWTVLCDPIFSDRCSPMQFAGPKRIRPSPLQVDGLPQIDIVVISHNHYDHLDLNTIVALNESQPECLFFVPLGMKEWFISVRCC